MKNILSSFLLLLTLTSFCQSYIIVEGQVTMNSNPVNDHPVLMYDYMDSSNVITTYTNPNGYYRDSVPAVSSQGNVVVYTYSPCDDSRMEEMRTYWPGNMNFQVDFACSLNCSADFWLSADTVQVNEQVIAEINENDTNYSYYIDFGDGFGEPYRVSDYRYDSAGTYAICASVNTGNCTDTVCKNIVVESASTPCQGDFTYTQNGYGAVTFYANVPGNGEVLWDFGNGSGGNGDTTVFQYSNEGEYTVCMTYGDTANNCYIDFCDTIDVVFTNNCSADFWLNADTVQVNEQVLAEINENDSSYSYYIDFGDGFGEPYRVSDYRYDSAGTYAICASVNTGNCTDTVCKNIVVESAPTPCQGDFTHTQSGYGAVTFHANVPGNGTIYWDFGNNAYGYGQTVTYQYSNAGYYYVCMTYDDSLNNCHIDFCDSVEVVFTNNCSADFWLSADTVRVNEQVLTEINENDTGYSYYINFGDGFGEPYRVSDHRYDTAGTYAICASVNTGNCTDTVCKNVVVEPDSSAPCSGSFTYDDNGYGAVFFTANVPANGQISWDFGNGAYASGDSVVYQYANEGQYLVCMTYSDSSNNCFFTVCDSIRVTFIQNNCSADFILSHDTASVNERVVVEIVENDSTNGYYIDFGDGYSEGNRVADHRYTQTGSYNICAFINTGNCSDTVCKTIVIQSASGTPYSILGEVKRDGGNPLDSGMVYLYNTQKLMDSLILSPADNGVYHFGVDSPGTYKTYAWAKGSTNEENLIPVYHYQSLFWEAADKIQLSDSVPSVSDAHIRLIEIPGASGVGRIIGQIFQKKSAVAPGVTVLLFKDSVSNPVASATTDLDGRYAFNDLPMGDYIVAVEVYKHKDEHIYITLEEGAEESTNNNYFIGDGKVIVLGLTPMSQLINVRVFPNPFDENLRITGINNAVDYTLSDITGKIHRQGTLKQNQEVVNTSSLKSGAYLLQLKGSHGIKTLRLLKP